MNISRKRKFPIYKETRGTKGHYENCSDFYFTYDLSKKDIGKFLNTWFVGQVATHGKEKFITRDEMITLKKCDDKTASCLYCRKFNPVSVSIVCPTGAKFKLNEKDEKLYNMVARIHSIDDSSFGIWFNELPLEKLRILRYDIMEFISSLNVINGEQFLERCIEFGADKDSIDYN